jgi:predicted RNA-binding protein
LKNNCLQNDQFAGEEEKEIYESSNKVMEDVIGTLKTKEEANVLTDYIRDFKLVFGIALKKHDHSIEPHPMA